MDVAASTNLVQADLKRVHMERENPFNKFEDSEVNESEILQQIAAQTEMSTASVDRKTLCVLGLDLSTESNLEDFMRHFDDTISKCFKMEVTNETDKRQRLADSANQSAARPLRTVWSKLLTDNSQPTVNGWHKPYATQLYVRTLLKQRQSTIDGESSGRYSVSSATECTKALLDTRRRCKYEESGVENDENELRACFDLHSLITAELPANLDEPFKSADEVLAEIDQLIQDGGITSLENDSISPTALELLHFKEQAGGTSAAELESSTFAPNLRGLSIGALSEYLEELEVLIRQLSEQLVQELAEREDIELERELKSEFVTLVTSLQKRQNDVLSKHAHALNNSSKSCMSASTGPVEQHSILSSPLSHLRKMSRSSSNVVTSSSSNTVHAGANATGHLFTEIPYHASNGSPDCELLQRFNVLLRAVLDNRANVPQLLTDYILNVYAPPSADAHTTIKLK